MTKKQKETFRTEHGNIGIQISPLHSVASKRFNGTSRVGGGGTSAPCVVEGANRRTPRVPHWKHKTNSPQLTLHFYLYRGVKGLSDISFNRRHLSL